MLPNLDRPHRRRILLRAAVATAVLAANPKWLRAQPATTPRVGYQKSASLFELQKAEGTHAAP